MQVAVTAVAVALALFGIRVATRLGRLENVNADLAGVLRERLAFVRGEYDLWLWASAAAILLLSWAINFLVDAVDGSYPIHHPLVFVGTNVAMFLIVYAALALSTSEHRRTLTAAAEDLQAQLEHTQAHAREDPARRRRFLALVALLTALLGLGIWMSLRALP